MFSGMRRFVGSAARVAGVAIRAAVRFTPVQRATIALGSTIVLSPAVFTTASFALHAAELSQVAKVDPGFAKFSEGQKFDEQKNYEAAAKCYKEAADLGSTKAKSLLAVFYFVGAGVPEDEKLALRYLTEAAEEGDRAAQFNLANCYLFGYEVKQDQRAALGWLTRAAAQGSLEAKYLAGMLMRADPSLHPQASELAIQYLESVSKNGDANADYELGLIYAQGKLVKADPKKANQYILKAAQAGCARALYDFAANADHQRAFAIYKKLAEDGDERAQLALGMMYIEGKSMPSNYTAGIRFLEKAADQGNEDAMRVVGQLWLAGKGVPKNPRTGIKYLEAAANVGDVDAQECLYNYFASDEGKNMELAALWYERWQKNKNQKTATTRYRAPDFSRRGRLVRPNYE